MSVEFVSQDFYVGSGGERKYHWVLLVELHNGVLHYTKSTNSLTIGNDNSKSREFERKFGEHPEAGIILGAPKLNGCHCMIVRYDNADGEQQISMCHFRPGEIDHSSHEYNPRCYEQLLKYVPRDGHIDVVLIGIHSEIMFQHTTTQLGIVVDTFRQINHHAYYDIQVSTISVTDIVFLGGGTWKQIGNNGQGEPRSVFINYFVEDDSIVLFGDKFKKLGRPTMHMARDVFLTKNMLLYFQGICVNSSVIENIATYGRFKTLLPLFQKKLYEHVMLTFYMDYVTYPIILNKKIPIKNAMLAEIASHFAIASAPLGEKETYTAQVSEKLDSLLLNDWDTNNYNMATNNL
jgi:hypothetical protein